MMTCTFAMQLSPMSNETLLLIFVFSSYVQRGTPPGEAIDRSNNQPHIVRFVGCEDLPPLHFIAVEQLVIECPNLINSYYDLFTLFSIWCTTIR